MSTEFRYPDTNTWAFTRYGFGGRDREKRLGFDFGSPQNLKHVINEMDQGRTVVGNSETVDYHGFMTMLREGAITFGEFVGTVAITDNEEYMERMGQSKWR